MSLSDPVERGLTYLLFVLHSISISLHILGLYLLNFQIKKDRSHQVPIMMNLSIAEILMSVFDVAYNVLTEYDVDKNIRDYVYTIQCTCFVISCFLVLTLLTLDRFFEVYLNIRYPIFFTKTVMTWCLIFCWVSGVSLGIILCLCRYLLKTDTLDIVFRILFPGFEILFFSCAVVTYTYIYSKFKNLSVDPNKKRTTKSQQRKFFVPNLIICTFFLFAIIPDQLHLFLFYIYDIGSNIFLNVILLLYVIGFICDAVIYIFFQKSTYKILRRKFGILFKSRSIHPETTITEKSRRASFIDSGGVSQQSQRQNDLDNNEKSSKPYLSVPNST